SVVQARTKKLLKRFMATPMRRSHYLLSFILSRLVFLFLEFAALVGFGWWMFHVGVRGSFAAVAAITVLGSLSFAGLGLLGASAAGPASLSPEQRPQPEQEAPRPAQRVAEGRGGGIASGRLACQRLPEHVLQLPRYVFARLVQRRRVLRGLARQNCFGRGSL